MAVHTKREGGRGHSLGDVHEGSDFPLPSPLPQLARPVPLASSNTVIATLLQTSSFLQSSMLGSLFSVESP